MMYLRSPRSEKVAKELANIREKISEKLFSGKIRLERNEEYLETSDGRKIPFSYMSSGQQELLPLWLTLNEFFDGDSANFSVYIEEPEAHLFPFSQGVLTEYLVTLLASSPGQKMLITTHSPYILAKINNLLKAGSLAARTSRKAQNSIENILPKSTWLRQESIAAYAIKGGDVVSIIGDDGLIDGDYLDGVSDEISRELNNLLEIQYAK
jgi:predicted ATP-dependent endonuclease of OLD family